MLGSGAMAQVACVKCQQLVEASETDVTADGAVCRRCIVAASTGPAVAGLERQLTRSTARKEIIAGSIMMIVGISMLALGLSVGRIALVSVAALVGGIVEIGRGIARLSSS